MKQTRDICDIKAKTFKPKRSESCVHISVRKKHNLHTAIWTLDIPVQHVQKQENALFKVPFKQCIIYIVKEDKLWRILWSC